MIDPRRRLGIAGEDLAAAFLRRHGLRVLDRNVRVGRGEVDILARHGGERVVVEVRTITGDHDPLTAFDAAKGEQVQRLGRILGAHRVDLVAIRLGHDAAEIRWARGAA